MPTAFETQMQTDMTAAFCSTSDFGETVTITTPGGTATTGVPAVYQEWLGAIDEKTQAVFIIPVASYSSPERGMKITRANGDVWTVVDVSQQDPAAFNCRGVLPQMVT